MERTPLCAGASEKSSKGGRRTARRRGDWRRWMFIGCLVVFLLSGGFLIRDQLRASREREANEALARQVRMAEQRAAAQREAAVTETGILPQYEALWEQNHDLAGWLSIEGTGIDYPVMHTPEDEEYYLRRAFDGSDSVSGTPFLAADCAEGCGNYIIYGHNMRDGSMFADLLDYADREFWEQHPVIRFDTLEEIGEYEVLAAFYTSVQLTGEESFLYYKYTDLQDAEVFAEYLRQIQSAALYDTGVTAEYGDQLLTLSTCSYHTGEGRFVVVARRGT